MGPTPKPMGASLRQGRGVLIEGRLQWRRGEQEGQSRCTREVIIERLQVLSRLRANVPEVSRGWKLPVGLVTSGSPARGGNRALVKRWGMSRSLGVQHTASVGERSTSVRKEMGKNGARAQGSAPAHVTPTRSGSTKRRRMAERRPLAGPPTPP